MIDYIDNTEEASSFVAKKLTEVKHLLDEIAQETGMVYVAMPEDHISFMASIGTRWSTWLNGVHRVVSDRMNLALEHREWMSCRHPEQQEEGDQHKSKGQPSQDDLFSGTDNSGQR